MKRHEDSAQHLRNKIHLAVLGTINIALQLSKDYRQQINKYNKKVKINLETLSKIDCTKFRDELELPLCGHDKTVQLPNLGFFKGLLEYAGKLDESCKTHFLKFSGIRTSKIIQNELLDCILKMF